MIDLELQAKINTWRQRASAGTLTQDEMREALASLRAGRISASHASAKSRGSRAKKAPIDAESLLGELEGL